MRRACGRTIGVSANSSHSYLGENVNSSYGRVQSLKDRESSEYQELKPNDGRDNNDGKECLPSNPTV